MSYSFIQSPFINVKAQLSQTHDLRNWSNILNDLCMHVELDMNSKNAF